MGDCGGPAYREAGIPLSSDQGPANDGEAGDLTGKPERIAKPPNFREHALHYADVLLIARGPRNDAATYTWAAEQQRRVYVDGLLIDAMRGEGRGFDKK